jgi:hypothetical protein
MGFQSIYAWKALSEAGFAEKAIIDSYRYRSVIGAVPIGI